MRNVYCMGLKCLEWSMKIDVWYMVISMMIIMIVLKQKWAFCSMWP